MSKLPNIETSIFSQMSSMATAYNAINLSQGFPNFPVDNRLIEIVKNSVSQNIHQYTSTGGYFPLLEKISTLISESYSRNTNPETEILITAGATQGIFTAIQAIVDTNDEVIILDPSYDSYEPSVLLSKGKPVRIALNDDYTTDWISIKKACSEKTKMLIINNPHNPTGTILRETDLLQLEQILEKYPKIILLSDEVYEYITFEEKHISAHTRPKLINRCIVISSFGKSFHITGWKIGYLIAPEHLMIEIKKVHQFLVFSVNSISQVALSQYLDVVNVSQLHSFYKEKRDYFRELLKHSSFELKPCDGTYFQVASYEKISDKNDVDFCKHLVREHGVAAIPISTFYVDKKDLHLIRFCFAKENETLEKASQLLNLVTHF